MDVLNINPNVNTSLGFKLSQECSEARFIIEGVDEFSVICKAIRDDDSIKVFIPRLLNLFRGGSYRARLEVVLENRLYTPIQCMIRIESDEETRMYESVSAELTYMREYID